MGKRVGEEAGRLLVIVFGIALNAFAVEAFTLPHNILIGGATGIGRLLHAFTPLSVSQGVLAINVLLLLLAFIFMGKRYAGSIVLGTFLYPFFLGVFERIPNINHWVEDPMLATLCGGFLMGLGIGIVIRVGGSLGGSDVMPMILHKKFRLPVAPVMWGLDVLVLVLQGFMATPNEIILGILLTLTYTIVTDRTLLAGGGQIQIMIFSPEVEKIREMLTARGFGVTLMHAKSGYRGDEVDVLLTVMSSRFLNHTKDEILSIDPKAFMTVSSVREVSGRGFTLSLDE